MQRHQHFYHYTSLAAALEIIRTDQVWLTDRRYLNDSAEFTYTSGIVIDKLMKNERDAASTLLTVYIQEELMVQSPLMVASMSENGDLLSQWRAYCELGKGLALGFERRSLKQLVSKRAGWLGKVEYREDKQKTELQQHIDWAKNELLARLPSPSRRSSRGSTSSDHLFTDAAQPIFIDVARLFVQRVIRLASIYKHPSFRDEREWRVVVPATDGDLRFRPGASYVVPYCSLALHLKETRALREVVVGPSPQPELAKKSMTQFLSKHLGYDVAVRLSETSFRAW